MHDRVIRFHGPINHTAVRTVLRRVREPDAPRIVHVNSDGGTFDFFSVLGPAVARQGLTMMSGYVASAAVILYMLGHRRLATADAQFFFHEVRALGNGVDGVMICDIDQALYEEERIEADQREFLEEWRRQMRAAQAWFVEFLARRLDMPPSTILQLMRSEATLDARDALRYGIVHQIVPHEQY